MSFAPHEGEDGSITHEAPITCTPPVTVVGTVDRRARRRCAQRRRARGVAGGVANAQLAVRECPPCLEKTGNVRLDGPRSARKIRRSGSISRILSRRSFRSDGGDHSSSPAVTRGVQQPTRGLRPGQPQTPPYLVLLRVGFSLPALSPGRRCALTAPFHPCHRRFPGSSAVCFLWHFP